EGTIASMQQPHFGDYSDVYQFDLQPLADVHFDPRYGGTITRAWLWIVVGISALLLLIVGINGGNLFTAQVRMRSQAVGVRRVLGATRRSLAAQLVWEVGLLVLVSMILAGYLTLEVIPYFLMEARFLQVPMPGVLWVIMVFAAVLLLLGCVGSPLVILGRLRPSTALRKRTTALGDSRKGGQALVIAQQVMAQVLLVCTITMAMQVKHLKHADLGFATEGTLLLDLPDTENSLLSSFRDQALRVASITDLTYCNKPPLSLGGGGQIRYGGGEWQNFAVRTRIVDEHYLGTFELPLIAGRNLLHSDTLREFLVNERLLSKLGISKPEKALGTTLVAGDLHNAEGIIVGVVADFHNQSLQGVIEPVLFTTYGAGYQLAAIRFTGNQGSTVLPYLEEAWQKTFPEEVFSYSFLEQELAMAYEQENTTMLLVQSGAALAIILSSLGLFGLMSLMVGQHEREIGIRKVLGSSVLGVLVLLLRRYLLWALLATVVAAPMGYLSMHNYLADFAYRIDLSVWMFLACALIGLGVTLLTVGFEALKAAKVNPVELLRSDG
ncbi:MAG TPA: hypothetical protein DCP28_01175, partial [Cytophagales bacterium]|nr:hypothetical protein [Cytophagales bacterium]